MVDSVDGDEPGAGRIDPRPILARMDGWELEVHVGDVLVSVVDQSAGRWMEAMLCTREEFCLLDLVDEVSHDALRDAIYRGEVSPGQRIVAYRNALELATGRDWYKAQNLAARVLEAWHLVIGPELTGSGSRFEDLTISELLDFGYYTLHRLLREEDWRSVLSGINTVPTEPGGDPDDMAMDFEDFQRLAAGL